MTPARRPWGRAREATRLLSVVLAVVTVVLAGAASPATLSAARAQTTGGRPPMTMSLVQIDGVVEAGEELSVTVDLATRRADRTEVRLVATLYGRVNSAPELAAALDGSPRNPFSSVALEIGDLGADLLHRVTLRATTDELDLDAADVEGVYPVELQVFEGADAVGAITTAAIIAPNSRRRPMPASVIVDVASSALPVRGDVADPALVAALGADGPLIRTARMLESIASSGAAAGLVLAVDGRLVEDLDAVADGVTPGDGPVVDLDSQLARRALRVREALATTAGRSDVQLVAMPYAQGDLRALSRDGLGAEVVRLVERGREVLEATLGETPAADALSVPNGLDPTTIDELSPLLTELYLVPGSSLDVPAANARMAPLRRLQTADGGELRVLHPEDELTSVLQDVAGRGTAAVTQEFLARTALRWIQGSRAAGQHTSTSDGSAAVVLHIPEPAALADDVLPTVLSAISRAAWLRPVNATRLAEVVDPAPQPAALASTAPSGRGLDAAYIQQLHEAHDALGPLEAMLPSGDPTADELRRSLDIAAGVANADPEARQTGLDRIQEILTLSRELAGAIDVFQGPTLTLTSTTGEVPVLIRSTAEQPLSVRVRVTSTRFEIDEPLRDVVLQPTQGQTVTFDVRALNPGALAGVNVTVQDPTGTLTLQRARISVRSTAFPVVALIATVGGALLLVWWGLRQGRRRRAYLPGALLDEEQVA